MGREMKINRKNRKLHFIKIKNEIRAKGVNHLHYDWFDTLRIVFINPMDKKIYDGFVVTSARYAKDKYHDYIHNRTLGTLKMEQVNSNGFIKSYTENYLLHYHNETPYSSNESVSYLTVMTEDMKFNNDADIGIGFDLVLDVKILTQEIVTDAVDRFVNGTMQPKIVFKLVE